MTPADPSALTRIAMIVPTYNEVDSIALLAEKLLALSPAIDVVCVDDASPDGTGLAADTIAAREPRYHVLHRTGPRGYSASCREGIAWCRERGYDLICTMDGDLSHDPAELPEMIACARGGADLVIGSRYVTGGGLEVDWGPVRRAVSEMGSGYARLMIRTPVRDCTSGYRCYRAEALAKVDFSAMRSDGYSFLIETLAALVDTGARVEEHAITYIDRKHGQSKISKRIIFEALLETTVIGFRPRGRRQR
jgi:dolichol-phosphate mannosyltransferase